MRRQSPQHDDDHLQNVFVIDGQENEHVKKRTHYRTNLSRVPKLSLVRRKI
jgi:hypothetical protein